MKKWFPVDKSAARLRLGLDPEEVIIGSFQRDTEGRDLISPKLEKGPDILCDVIERVNRVRPVTVLLGGWRREYVIGRLRTAGVKHIFMKLPPQETVRDMYASCDYYLCTARHEGGPQCVLEAAAMRVPIFSTPVGIARDVLHETQIIDPGTWMPAMPTQEAIDHSYESARLRDPKLLALSYEDTFRKIQEVSAK
jgi:glycosyltransferase involved in cell wall biosynthesis